MCTNGESSVRVTRERESHRGIPELCGPFPETHRTKEGGRLGRINAVQLMPLDGVGFAKRISIDERMAQQCQKAKDGQNYLRK
jgi:hypothetical protein